MLEEKDNIIGVTITDPKLEPFYVTKDSYCYTIMERVTPTYTENTKQYSRSVGHYSNFGSCLKKIMTLKLDNKKNYDSVSQYLKEFKQIENSINQLTNIEI
jgi:23S rRNA C2498 (ribose-2'-O)-methylase RlmM